MEAAIVETLAAAADTLREADVADTLAAGVDTLRVASVPLTDRPWYALLILAATVAIPVVYILLFVRRRKIETTPKVLVSITKCIHTLPSGARPMPTRLISVEAQVEHVEGPSTQLKTFHWNDVDWKFASVHSKDEIAKRYILRDGNWFDFGLTFYVAADKFQPDADGKVTGTLQIQGTRNLNIEVQCDATAPKG